MTPKHEYYFIYQSSDDHKFTTAIIKTETVLEIHKEKMSDGQGLLIESMHYEKHTFNLTKNIK